MVRSTKRRGRSRSRTRKHKRKSSRRRRTRRSRGGAPETPQLDACGSTPLTRAIAAGPGAASAYPEWDATLDVQKRKLGTVDGMTNRVVVFTPTMGGSTIAWCHKSAASRLFSALRTPRGETKFVDLNNTQVTLKSKAGNKATFLLSQLLCRTGSTDWELTSTTETPLYTFLDQMTGQKPCGGKFDGVEEGTEM